MSYNLLGVLNSNVFISDYAGDDCVVINSVLVVSGDEVRQHAILH